MTDCVVVDGLHVREREPDESERKQGVVRRFEVREPMTIPPMHIKSVIQQARTGTLLCSCQLAVECRHTGAVAALLARRTPPPNLDGRSHVA